MLRFTEGTQRKVRRAFDQVVADGSIYCYDGLNRSRALRRP
ncbi:MAG: hypothetical protein ACREMQ_20560 [Longimicrobiales bacterium]